MIHYTLFNNNGEIMGNAFCSELEIVYNKGSYSYIQGEYSSDFGYISNGEFVEYTPEQLTAILAKPKTHHIWDNSVMRWLDNRPLELARSSKRFELNQARDLANKLPIEFNGNLFDADDAAVTNISGAVTFLPDSYQLQWTLFDNTQVTITVADLRNIGLAIVARTAANHYRCVALKDSLDLMETNEEINSVVF